LAFVVLPFLYFFHPLARKIVEKCFAMQIFVNQAETELRATSWSSCWPTHKKRVSQGRALELKAHIKRSGPSSKGPI